nr:HNH endonuclease [Defluviimonas salinarum]
MVSGLALLRNPASVDRAVASAPTARIVAEIKRFRPERIWGLSEADVTVIEQLIAGAGGLQSFPATDPIADALRRNGEGIETAIAQRKQAWIKPRPGQAEFRKAAFERHRGQCVFTETDVAEALEAAHVIPHTGEPEFERPENSLLLRRDVHALFDLFLLSIDPATASIVVSRKLDGSPYEDLRKTPVDHQLARSALEFHYQHFLETE